MVFMVTFSFLNQTLWCDPHWNRLSETISMSDHTIGSGREIRKLAFWKLSILDLICCPGFNCIAFLFVCRGIEEQKAYRPPADLRAVVEAAAVNVYGDHVDMDNLPLTNRFQKFNVSLCFRARTVLFSQLADFRQYLYFPLAKSGFYWLLIVTWSFLAVSLIYLTVILNKSDYKIIVCTVLGCLKQSKTEHTDL